MMTGQPHELGQATDVPGLAQGDSNAYYKTLPRQNGSGISRVTTIVHPRITLLIIAVCLSGCSLLGRRTTPDIPEDEARHRAALTELSVDNHTDQNLTIAFRAATPPAQEIVLGLVAAGKLQKVAPVPAGEPIVLVARRRDGKELLLPARSYPIDGDWTWEIPATAPFR